ncbi:testis-specific serine/threonine-protein kinase 6-like [Astyanax mexicanus]|uniref:testis-specific serine/threonine-protein kinase 6-like n=1 Tax=Astyanax mexicanus TaxID=7994 RepID=UPI0020CB332F|nr:testis-specific serine/threonine-protein kinase 6-like [Astyanax mexicanus]
MRWFASAMRWFKYFFSLLRQPEIDETDTMKFLGFEVCGVIGSGGFGVVKLAKSKKHKSYVAIKTMDCRWVALRSQYSVLEVEIDIISKIRHPHIVHVYEVIRVWDKEVYIVMEAAQSSLGEVLKTGPIPSHTARRWFSQLVSALDYMHEQDIVHHDLKCDNILVTEDCNVKITDFGLSCVTKGYPELCNTFCGTLGYISPEVHNREAYDGKKSDVWSLGIVLYVMVTGKLPSCSRKKKELANLFPDYVEESCRALILDMLQLDPSARPTVRKLSKHPWLQSDVQDTPTSEDDSPETFTSEDKWSETFTSEDKWSETFTSEDEGSVTFTSEDKGSETFTSEDKWSETFTSEDEGSVTFTSEDKGSETFTSEDEGSVTFTSEDKGSETFTSEDEGSVTFTSEDDSPEEEHGFGCLGRILPFQAVLKRVAGACAKAFRVFRQRVKRLFRK